MDPAAIDRHLRLILGELRSKPDADSNSRTLGLVGTTFAILHNPLNLTLLTSQVLTAPAIWSEEDGLQSCVRCMRVFQQAASIIVRQERDSTQARRGRRHNKSTTTITTDLQIDKNPVATDIPRDDWLRAVYRGADARSPTWSHTLVLGGLLVGFEGTVAGHLPGKILRYLTSTLIDVVNQSLQELSPEDELGRACISMVLTYCNDFMPPKEALRLDHDRLLPTLIKSAFVSEEGYKGGYIMDGLDADIVQQHGDKFTWSSTSPSFRRMSSINTKPLHSAMGSLSKLMAMTIEQVSDTRLIRGSIEDLASFARAIQLQWRQTKLSEVDVAEESLYFDEHALNVTLPTLWKLLRHAVFGSVLVLRSIVARALSTASLGSDGVATVLAEQSLNILRNLYFVSNRLGVHSFQQHSFVYLTAVDILSKQPVAAIAFIKSISPPSLGKIPRHPLDRNLDLYFLNTAEHFASVLPSHVNDEILVAAASPYLAEGGNKHLLEVFEAAHSVMLAVLSSPQSAELSSKYAPFYVNALFSVFPNNISSRQFRLAYRTLLEVCSPPRPLSGTHPELTGTLLELIRHRASTQSDSQRAALFEVSSTEGSKREQKTPLSPSLPEDDERLDERTALTLTLIDCLSLVPVAILETWLSLTAQLIPRLRDEEARTKARSRFWDVISNGEMDVERSRVCVVWWSTKSGREAVLNETEPSPKMGGALETGRGPVHGAKL